MEQVGFDRVEIIDGSAPLKRMNRAEYERLELRERVRLLLAGSVRFYRSDKAHRELARVALPIRAFAMITASRSTHCFTCERRYDARAHCVREARSSTVITANIVPTRKKTCAAASMWSAFCLSIRSASKGRAHDSLR